jgi:hypothetical protein
MVVVAAMMVVIAAVVVVIAAVVVVIVMAMAVVIAMTMPTAVGVIDVAAMVATTGRLVATARGLVATARGLVATTRRFFAAAAGRRADLLESVGGAFAGPQPAEMTADIQAAPDRSERRNRRREDWRILHRKIGCRSHSTATKGSRARDRHRQTTHRVPQ